MRLVAIAVVATVVSGCSASDPICGGVTLTHQGGGNAHVPSCGDPGVCGNGLNPPTAGNHCEFTLACREYSTEQPRCSWIHNLEHGHAVLLYNCPAGCPELVASLHDVWAGSGALKRVIVAPDPNLPTAVAAVVWGYSWTGDAFDSGAVQCLLSHQDEDAPEAGLGCTQ